MNPKEIIKTLENPLSSTRQCQKAMEVAMRLDINKIDANVRSRLLKLF